MLIFLLSGNILYLDVFPHLKQLSEAISCPYFSTPSTYIITALPFCCFLIPGTNGFCWILHLVSHIWKRFQITNVTNREMSIKVMSVKLIWSVYFRWRLRKCYGLEVKQCPHTHVLEILVPWLVALFWDYNFLQNRPSCRKWVLVGSEVLVPTVLQVCFSNYTGD